MFFFPQHLYTEGYPAAAQYQTCSPTLKAEPLIQELSPHFQKATLLSAFLTLVAVSKHIGLAFKTRLLPTVGSGWSKKKEGKKKKKSQVKFKDVFLLEARLRCHKPRETFSCSTFFMVSLWVSSLPFSLHLGSRVTYCCTGCGPQPAGHCGVASSSLWAPNRSPPLPKLHQKSSAGCPWMEDPSENPPPGQPYLNFLSPPLSNNTLPTYPGLMANSNQL